VSRRIVDVCNAIDPAHGRGILHQDIKPGNVIVGRHGATLVVDWGLAKPIGRTEARMAVGERALSPLSAGGTAETLPGSTPGTPVYLSPEQRRATWNSWGRGRMCIAWGRRCMAQTSDHSI
jgi:serine/threonine protein kinase